MIESLLGQIVSKGGHQVSFVLGQKILYKTGVDWVESQENALKINEWEDLKDICLQGTEKIQLETKGFVSGAYLAGEQIWKFSFIERKDCFRAFMSLTERNAKTQCQVQNPLFWDLLKKDKGIFIFAGPRRSGKSSLISEILDKRQNEKVNLIGIHALENEFQWPQIDNIIHLGGDTADWDLNHMIYDGIENVVVDFNAVKKWEKWIELCEQGRSMYMTLTAENLVIIFQQVFEKMSPGLIQRFMNLLNGIVVQKLVGQPLMPVYELLLLKNNDRAIINKIVGDYRKDGTVSFSEMPNENYQSLNQSIIQSLVRRYIDVKTAFAASDDPEDLDQKLKKMGL